MLALKKSQSRKLAFSPASVISFGTSGPIGRDMGTRIGSTIAWRGFVCSLFSFVRCPLPAPRHFESFPLFQLA
jgi:hypothetical protein